jgi:transcription-repair coupling factor (superfamily II helicase)
MNVNDIISKYTESPQLQSINQWLRDTTSGDIHISGLVGSSDAFVASSVFKSTEYNHFFILNNKEEAAYFQNNLKSLLQQKDVFYFPDSFKRPQVFDEILNTNILMRTETVNRLINTNSKAELVVTYPEALIEQVVKADKLNEQTLNLEVGERMDIDFAIDLLVEFDFERVDFVYEPGQFSIRGGIVDIYSFGNEYPYRIELDDDNIASIRTFDTNTQLSVKKISRITIVPNIQTFFSNEFKMPLFESLKENTAIWVKDMELLIDVMNTAMEKEIGRAHV